MDISKIILWNNCYILIGGKTVFNKRLVDKGIVRIGDLIAENNEIIRRAKGVKFIPIGRISTFFSDRRTPEGLASCVEELLI